MDALTASSMYVSCVTPIPIKIKMNLNEQDTNALIIKQLPREGMHRKQIS